VYPLPRTSRLIDAVELAGGLLPDADTNAINLAARLMDGDKIVIPFSGETLATVIQRSIETQNGLSPVPASALEKYPIDLNTATLEELLYLPGIGPTKAAEIIAYRQQNGAFQRPEDVLKVPGIGDVTYEQIREFVIAGETP
jgi:competence protein ComEA